MITNSVHLAKPPAELAIQVASFFVCATHLDGGENFFSRNGLNSFSIADAEVVVNGPCENLQLVWEHAFT